MADETMWDTGKWTAIGAAVGAFFVGLFRRTRSAASGDLHARLEAAELRIQEQERAMSEAVTAVKRLDERVVSFERKLNRVEIRAADHRSEVLDELRVCREALSAVVERLTTVLSQQRARQQDLGQAG